MADSKYVMKVRAKIRWWIKPLLKIMALFKMRWLLDKIQNVKVADIWFDNQPSQPLYFKDFSKD